jgi:uncharacterized protein (DUF433 family)
MGEWIVADPAVLDGKPCVRGTRISVEFILELLASRGSREEVLRAYPQVTDEGLSAALDPPRLADENVALKSGTRDAPERSPAAARSTDRRPRGRQRPLAMVHQAVAPLSLDGYDSFRWIQRRNCWSKPSA